MCYITVLSMRKIIYHWGWKDEWEYTALVECHQQAKRTVLGEKPVPLEICPWQIQHWLAWHWTQPPDSDRPASGMILIRKNQSSSSKTCPSATLPQKPHELAWDWTQAFMVRHQQLTAYSYRRIQKWSCWCTTITKCHQTAWTRQQRHNDLFPHQQGLSIT